MEALGRARESEPVDWVGNEANDGRPLWAEPVEAVFGRNGNAVAMMDRSMLDVGHETNGCENEVVANAAWLRLLEARDSISCFPTQCRGEVESVETQESLGGASLQIARLIPTARRIAGWLPGQCRLRQQSRTRLNC